MEKIHPRVLASTVIKPKTIHKLPTTSNEDLLKTKANLTAEGEKLLGIKPVNPLSPTKITTTTTSEFHTKGPGYENIKAGLPTIPKLPIKPTTPTTPVKTAGEEINVNLNKLTNTTPQPKKPTYVNVNPSTAIASVLSVKTLSSAASGTEASGNAGKKQGSLLTEEIIHETFQGAKSNKSSANTSTGQKPKAGNGNGNVTSKVPGDTKTGVVPTEEEKKPVSAVDRQIAKITKKAAENTEKQTEKNSKTKTKAEKKAEKKASKKEKKPGLIKKLYRMSLGKIFKRQQMNITTKTPEQIAQNKINKLKLKQSQKNQLQAEDAERRAKEMYNRGYLATEKKPINTGKKTTGTGTAGTGTAGTGTGTAGTGTNSSSGESFTRTTTKRTYSEGNSGSGNSSNKIPKPAKNIYNTAEIIKPSISVTNPMYGTFKNNSTYNAARYNTVKKPNSVYNVVYGKNNPKYLNVSSPRYLHTSPRYLNTSPTSPVYATGNYNKKKPTTSKNTGYITIGNDFKNKTYEKPAYAVANLPKAEYTSEKKRKKGEYITVYSTPRLNSTTTTTKSANLNTVKIKPANINPGNINPGNINPVNINPANVIPVKANVISVAIPPTQTLPNQSAQSTTITTPVISQITNTKKLEAKSLNPAPVPSTFIPTTAIIPNVLQKTKKTTVTKTSVNLPKNYENAIGNNPELSDFIKTKLNEQQLIDSSKQSNEKQNKLRTEIIIKEAIIDYYNKTNVPPMSEELKALIRGPAIVYSEAKIAAEIAPVKGNQFPLPSTNPITGTKKSVVYNLLKNKNKNTKVQITNKKIEELTKYLPDLNTENFKNLNTDKQNQLISQLNKVKGLQKRGILVNDKTFKNIMKQKLNTLNTNT